MRMVQRCKRQLEISRGPASEYTSFHTLVLCCCCMLVGQHSLLGCAFLCTSKAGLNIERVFEGRGSHETCSEVEAVRSIQLRLVMQNAWCSHA